MPVESVPHRDSSHAILLRESGREDGTVRKRPSPHFGLIPGHGDFNDDLAVLGPRTLAARQVP